ncbi:MAG: ribonuclease E/G [Lachnospiraceae bacterium]|nr:ribonuclease E/G [Lachnospiraceae bacterium]
MNRLAITPITKHGKSYIAQIVLDENRDYLDFQIYEDENDTLMNRIYIARVESIVKGIHAAFVRITGDMKCYLPLEDCVNPYYTRKQSQKEELCVGDELLVQVVRDAVKSKEPVVTTKLTLQGKCSVLTTENHALSVSRKITGEKRTALSAWLSDRIASQWPENGRGFGMILRTAAGELPMDEIQEDVISLVYTLEKIKEKSLHLSAFSMVYQDPPPYISRIKSLRLEDCDKILTDSEEIFHQLTSQLPTNREKCELYRDDVISLNRLYKVDTTLEELLKQRVWLKSGSNIIVEQLETLTFIDVNSAKNQSARQDTILQVNMEAAREVARQLRLRNISGMIIVDFINMKSKEEELALIECLKGELKKDTVPCHFVDITKLGLVEITRKKVYRSLKELIG